MTILKNSKRAICFLLLGPALGCAQPSPEKTIIVKNGFDMGKHRETIVVLLKELGTEESDFQGLMVKDTETGEYSFTQLVDQDGNGVVDALIFQASVPPLSEKKYELIKVKNTSISPDTLVAAFSRFVPERIDDYAWENDRVAFRTYGPEAERLAKEKLPGGTLSSGIDCWLKKVSYPVINKWYKLGEEGISYHTDHGEGLDNYHVGSSRGCGGIGIRKGDNLYVSDNFTAYKTMETGPLRTVFELEYAPWKAGKMMVKEKKRISLDLGSNLSKIEVQFAPPYPEEIVAGLAIPGKEGKGGVVSVDEKTGWFSFWSEHYDSELGIGIVVDPKYVSGYTEYRVPKVEKSHVFVHLRLINGKVIYYTGFGWKKNSRFSTRKVWEEYLREFALVLSFPAEIKISNP